MSKLDDIRQQGYEDGEFDMASSPDPEFTTEELQAYEEGFEEGFMDRQLREEMEEEENRYNDSGNDCW